MTLLAGAAAPRPLPPDPTGADGTSRDRQRSSDRWVVFAIVSIALFMSSLDATIVATGLPTISRALHTRLAWVSWTMTAYQLGLVTAMPVAGRVADVFGRKRVFVAAALLFTGASLACGSVDRISLLVPLRALQAVGGAAFLPAASGMVVDVFGPDRHRALGLFSSVFPLGALAGPIAGGLILTDWTWRGLFLVNVPVGAAFTLLALRYLPSSPRRNGRADLLGAALIAATVLATMLAITDAGSGRSGPGAWSVVAPGVVAAGCGALLLRRAVRAADPVIPARLLRGWSNLSMHALNFVWGACVIGLGSLVPLVAEERYGLGPLPAGTLLSARAVSEVGIAVVVSFLIHRTGFRLPIIAGIASISAGLLLLASPAPIGPYPWLMLGAALTGIGIGVSAPAANNASFELAPDDVGAVSGLRGATRQFGAIVAVASTTALMDRSSDQVGVLVGAFAVLGVVLFAMSPLAFAVPNRPRVREPDPGRAGGSRSRRAGSR